VVGLQTWFCVSPLCGMRRRPEMERGRPSPAGRAQNVALRGTYVAGGYKRSVVLKQACAPEGEQSERAFPAAKSQNYDAADVGVPREAARHGDAAKSNRGSTARSSPPQ
jgi:hypothetical protein